MASQLINELIEAGIHFGHRASNWNPKMKPYIFGKRNGLHIIDVKETLRGLMLAKKLVTQTVAKGKDILIIGTKRQARKAIKSNVERIEMHGVYDRWLGGTLTNFREIRKRIGRLDQLELLETEGRLDAYSKKEGASLRREMRKIQRNLGGIRKMDRLPGVMVVVDVSREVIAIREAKKMGITVIGLIDTDADPDLVDIAIPGNDDAMRSIEVVLRELCNSAEEGKGTRVDFKGPGDNDNVPRRRSQRATTARAEDAGEEEATEAEATTEAPAVEAAPAPAPEASSVAPIMPPASQE